MLSSLRKLFDRLVLWLLSTLITVMVTGFSLFARQRMSHLNGVLARGKVKFFDQLDFPANDFFQAGREFKARVRFSTVSFFDDTVREVRGASIKFADSDYASPFDMEFNTGKFPLFETIWHFWQVMGIVNGGAREKWLPYFKKYPRFEAAAKTCVRRAPESFVQLYYYSQTPFAFRAKDNTQYYVKYRLIPADRSPEAGLPEANDQANIWDLSSKPNETRPPDYLKTELQQRVQKRAARLIFQLQLHQPQASDTAEIFNSSVEWDLATHPWQDVGLVEVENVLAYPEAEQTHFSIGLHPASLGILPANSINDYNSLNVLRKQVLIAKRARVLAYKLFGIPPLVHEKHSAPQVGAGSD